MVPTVADRKQRGTMRCTPSRGDVVVEVVDRPPRPGDRQRSSCYFTLVGSFTFEAGSKSTPVVVTGNGPSLRDATSVSC